MFIERVNRRTIFRRSKGRCGICKQKLNPRRWTIDHIIPLSRGGTHEYANVQPAHRECNMFKSNLMPHELLELAQPAVAGYSAKARYRNNANRRKRPHKK